MLGGLSGKASLIDREKKTIGNSLLLLDSGKSLFKGKNNINRLPLIKARGIAKAYMVMGYDAVAVSASDIENDEEFLEDTLNDGFPWISANLVDKNGKSVTKAYLLKTINSLRIAIIGLTEKLAPSSIYSTLDYSNSLTILLKQLTTEADIIILLSNLQAKDNLQIAKQFPDIDIIFSSDRSLGKMAPKVMNNTLITQTSSRGKYLGKLDVEWNHGNTWFNDRLRPLAELKKRRITIGTQLTQLGSNKNNANKKRISRLQRQQQQLEKEIVSRSEQESEHGERPYNKYKLRFIPVQPTHSPEAIESIVQNINKSIKEQSSKN